MPWSRFTGSVIIILCQTIPVKPSEQLFNMFGSGAGTRRYASIVALGVRLRLLLHFYWSVLCSFTPAVCRRAPNRTACGILRFYSAWVGIAISAFSKVVRLSGFVGSLWDGAFLYGDPDGVRGVWRTRGTELAARQSALLREPVGFDMLSAGSTLGLKCGSRTAAAPDCAKESATFWTLFF